jgi:hypothetical protein
MLRRWAATVRVLILSLFRYDLVDQTLPHQDGDLDLPLGEHFLKDPRDAIERIEAFVRFLDCDEGWHQRGKRSRESHVFEVGIESLQ